MLSQSWNGEEKKSFKKGRENGEKGGGARGYTQGFFVVDSCNITPLNIKHQGDVSGRK